MNKQIWDQSPFDIDYAAVEAQTAAHMFPAIEATYFPEGQEVNTVNARELWEKLGVGKVFGAWITERILKYDFTEGLDFIPVLEKSTGGRPAKEYFLTLNMAKELCMVENNEQGKMIRKYFIECERQAKQKPTFQLPQTYTEALEHLLAQTKENEKLAVERDEAIKTKARIDSKRSATAMATASAEKRKRLKVEDEIGRGKNMKTVRAIPWFKEFFSVKDLGAYSKLGKAIKDLSKYMGYEVKRVETTDGMRNAYHKDVIEAMKWNLIDNPHCLRKWRTD